MLPFEVRFGRLAFQERVVCYIQLHVKLAPQPSVAPSYLALFNLAVESIKYRKTLERAADLTKPDRRDNPSKVPFISYF